MHFLARWEFVPCIYDSMGENVPFEVGVGVRFGDFEVASSSGCDTQFEGVGGYSWVILVAHNLEGFYPVFL